MKTTFVVGAGASADFGFPVGAALQSEIAEYLKPRRMVRSGAISHLGSIEGELAKRGLSGFDLTSRCEWFANTLPLSDSIDRFLEDQSSHDDWISFLGKYSIAKIIGERERASYLNRRELPMDFARFSDTWLGQFWAKMNKGGGAKIDETKATASPRSAFLWCHPRSHDDNLANHPTPYKSNATKMYLCLLRRL